MFARQLAAIFAIALSLPAHAQVAGVMADGQGGASLDFCPLPPQADGSMVCMTVHCAPSGWSAEMQVAGAVPPDSFPATIAADGTTAAALNFTLSAVGDTVRVYAAPITGARFDLLKAATSGRLTVVIGQTPYPYDFPMTGAGASLEQMEAICAGAPSGDIGFAARVAAQKEAIRAECGNMGAVTFDDAVFARRQDIDGDGRPDIVFDHGGVQCGTSFSYYCGSAGCVTAFALAEPAGGYVDVGLGNIRGFETPAPGVLRLHLHGGSCGLSGADACVKDYRIERAPGSVEFVALN